MGFNSSLMVILVRYCFCGCCVWHVMFGTCFDSSFGETGDVGVDSKVFCNHTPFFLGAAFSMILALLARWNLKMVPVLPTSCTRIRSFFFIIVLLFMFICALFLLGALFVHRSTKWRINMRNRQRQRKKVVRLECLITLQGKHD